MHVMRNARCQCVCVSGYHDTAKDGCDHLDAVNRTWIHPKIRRLAIRASRFVVDDTFKDAPSCSFKGSQSPDLRAESPRCNKTSSNSSCSYLTFKRSPFLTQGS
ncbi:hypothetical protein TNCV_1319261 [Trichonephila clavipes]|nr:hypothetical protein TNCV_1319261 [Trichonephila clavipes]